MNHQETKFIIAFKIKIFALNNQVLYFLPPWVKKQKKKATGTRNKTALLY